MGLCANRILNIEIKGTGIAFPSKGKWISNEDIHTMLHGENWQQVMASKKLEPDYYYKEYGFKKRYWVHTPGTLIVHNELTSAYLMLAAANDAIKNSGVKKDEIDFIIAVTITSPRYSTSMGAYVAGLLGVRAPAIEMKSGCASNVFAMVLASQMIQNGARNVLIVCGETNSKIMKMEGPVPYAGGDAGAAVILSAAKDSHKGIIASCLNTDGAYSSYMGVPGLMPPNKKDLEAGNYYLSFSDGANDFLDHTWRQIPETLYKISGMKPEDISYLVPHQVHKKRTEFASTASGISLNNTINIIDEYANCGSASLLLALHHAKENNWLDAGNNIMLMAAGGGISWGGFILHC